MPDNNTLQSNHREVLIKNKTTKKKKKDYEAVQEELKEKEASRKLLKQKMEKKWENKWMGGRDKEAQKDTRLSTQAQEGGS